MENIVKKIKRDTLNYNVEGELEKRSKRNRQLMRFSEEAPVIP